MRSETQSTYHERILRVLVHIQRNLDEALDLESLAHVAHFSPYHFHRIFRSIVGESVKEHIRRLRLERAAVHLKHTDAKVTSIAFQAGYETHEAFTRAFGTMFGASPSDYRSGHQAAMPPVANRVHYETNPETLTFEPYKGGAPVDVRIETIDPVPVAFMRHVGPYHEVGAAFQKLMGWAGPRGLIGPGVSSIGVYHDDPEVTPPDKLRADACISVRPDFEPEGEIGFQTLAGGACAVAVHRGPYEKLPDVYRALIGEWLPASGRELRAAPPMEFYRNSPMDTKPEDLYTEIYLPLASE